MSDQAIRNMDEDEILARIADWDTPDWAALMENKYFTPKWVVQFLKRPRAVSQHAIMEIYNNHQLRRRYRVCFALTMHPNTPPSIALALMNTLRWGDILTVLRQPRISAALQSKGVEVIEERLPRLTLGEKVSLARRAPRPLIRVLRTLNEPGVLRIVFNNTYFTDEDALYVASYPKTHPPALGALAGSAKWTRIKEIARALIIHPRTPRHAMLPLLRSMLPTDWQTLKADPRVGIYAKRLIDRLIKGH